MTTRSPARPELWRHLQQEDPARWQAETRGLSTVWGRNPEQVRQALSVLACSRARILDILSAARFTGVTAVVLVDDPKAWDAMLQADGFRPDSLALHLNGEIYLRVEAETVRPERLAHELVHRVLHADMGEEIPLWLDEGVSSYVGWKAARACREAEGVDLTQSYPPCPGALLSTKDLTERRAYPSSADEARVFYRQAEELVTAIVEEIGEENLLAYARAVAHQPRRWQKILVSQWGMTETEWASVEAKVEARMRMTWRR